jgi:hypothetical protein
LDLIQTKINSIQNARKDTLREDWNLLADSGKVGNENVF